MNALQLISEAAVRVGIVQPSTIENVSNPDPSKKDPDSMVLLGALNETMRQAVVLNLFDQYSVMKKINLTITSTSGFTFLYDLYGSLTDYGGMLSSYFNVRVAAQTGGSDKYHTYFQADNDIFLKYWVDPSETVENPVLPNKNMYRIFDGKLAFIASKPIADYKPTALSFTYRSKYGVRTLAGDIVNSFTFDTDTSNIDDELLIAGTALNYKAYNGIDYTFDLQKYQNYITALERNRQMNNLFRDTTLRPAQNA